MAGELTFEEVNCYSSSYSLLNAFGIEANDSICEGCANEDVCYAKDLFHDYYPSDSIAKCKYYKEF